jgi:hypothetical protein
MARAAGVAALVAFALLASASWAGTSHTYTVAGPIDSLGLSASGGSVAIHAAVEDGCPQSGLVWTPSTGHAIQLEDGCSSDGSYENLTLIGSTAIWWDYDAGNHVYCSDVYTSPVAHPKPHGLGVCDGSQGDTYYEFAGDKTIVTVSDYTVCESDCTGADGKLLPDGNYGVEVKRLVGGKVVPLLKPVDMRTFLDARNWRVAVVEPSGVLTVYDTHGTKMWTAPSAGNLSSGWLAGNTVVGQQGNQIAVYAPGKAAHIVKTIPKKAVLTDVAGGIAVYISGSTVHLLRVSDGRDRALVTVKGLSDAQLSTAGLFYGVTTKNYDGVVTFVPLSDVLRKLR